MSIDQEPQIGKDASIGSDMQSRILYGFGYNRLPSDGRGGYKRDRYIAHVRGAIASCEVIEDDILHLDGVTLVDPLEWDAFCDLVRKAGTIPQNVMLYPYSGERREIYDPLNIHPARASNVFDIIFQLQLSPEIDSY